MIAATAAGPPRRKPPRRRKAGADYRVCNVSGSILSAAKCVMQDRQSVEGDARCPQKQGEDESESGNIGSL